MRGFPLLLAATLLAACGGQKDGGTAESTNAGVERANADIRAAEAAARAPVSVNRSVGELTGRPVKDARDAPPPKPRPTAEAEPPEPAEEPAPLPAAPNPQP